jgi:hypothetical protein
VLDLHQQFEQESVSCRISCLTTTDYRGHLTDIELVKTSWLRRVLHAHLIWALSNGRHSSINILPLRVSAQKTGCLSMIYLCCLSRLTYELTRPSLPKVALLEEQSGHSVARYLRLQTVTALSLNRTPSHQSCLSISVLSSSSPNRPFNLSTFSY